MTYRALIVDDEAYAREIVRSLLAKDSDFELIGSCTNGSEAIEMIGEKRPDIVFLDIQMPGIDGFKVIEQTRAVHTPYYVFATAYDAFALKAFEVNALDYLLKPFDDQRFFETLERAKTALANREKADLKDQLSQLLVHQSQAKKSFLRRISIKTGGRIHFINTEDIDWIEADNQYVKIHCTSKAHTHRQSLTELEGLLDPERFVRVHRSAIVNVNRIQSLEPHFRGDFMITLHNGTKVKLAQSRKENLRQLMGW